MNVLENVSYGLKMPGVAREEARRRGNEALKNVGLVGYDERLPSELSRGQQQHVALARAPQDADALRQQAERLPDIERPRILHGDIDDLPRLLSDLAAHASDSLLFDAIVGRNALTRHANKPAAATLLALSLIHISEPTRPY